MKNIFKKNSIIITALAIMIVIAGYLSFTNKDTKDDAGILTDATTTVTDEFVETDGLDVATNTTGTDTTGTTTTDTTDTTTTDTTTTDTTDTTVTDTTDDTNAATTDVNDENATETEDATDELGNNDISDSDILANAQDVSDNGELNLEEGTPGEAVLANTADASYFVSNKIEREQVRAKNKDTYMDIIESADVTEEDKQAAIDSMIELTDITEKESAAEMLLEAKGFDGVVVFVVDGSADVVVNAASLTDQQRAIIEDVVKQKTDIAVENIEITPVVLSE
ncbi:MAG: SpoIIIAH-like family protein [Herbinix sp.]|nr:SpoIIIAH-like family protein [Herbinix sp.]